MIHILLSLKYVLSFSAVKIIKFFYQLLYFTILRLHRPTIRIEFSMNFLYSVTVHSKLQTVTNKMLSYFLVLHTVPCYIEIRQNKLLLSIIFITFQSIAATSNISLQISCKYMLCDNFLQFIYNRDEQNALI